MKHGLRLRSLRLKEKLPILPEGQASCAVCLPHSWEVSVMSHVPAIIDPALLALIKHSFDEKGLPLPFVREIFLLLCGACEN